MTIYKKGEESIPKPTEGGQYILANVLLERETSSVISGSVKDADGNAIVGAGVILVEIDSVSNTRTDKATTFTDNNGKFGFPFKINSTDSNITYEVDVFAPNLNE